MSTVEAADMSALASARTGTAGGTMRPDMRGRARIIYQGGPGRGPASSVVQRQRDEQRDDERDVGERDRRALPRRQRVVTRYGVAPAPHEGEEPDDQHDQEERRAGEQERGGPSIATNAPTNGMNTGAPAGMPSRRSATAWPISWTKISSTKPAAKAQPHSIA